MTYQQPPASNPPPPPPASHPRPAKGSRRKWWLLGAAVLVVFAIIGAATNSGKKKPTADSTVARHATTSVHTSSRATHASASSRYDQTWPKSYGDTTCADWLDRMSDQQRFVAAHDIIIALKARDQSDAFARGFAADIAQACQPVPQLDMSQVAAGIATLDTTDFPR